LRSRIAQEHNKRGDSKVVAKRPKRVPREKKKRSEKGGHESWGKTWTQRRQKIVPGAEKSTRVI